VTDVPFPERGLVDHPVERFGTSRGGRPLEVFGPVAPRTPLVLAGIHGNETETVVALSAAVRMVGRGELRCAVVLSANPDGAARGTRGNAAGVDVNRNFPAQDWRAGKVLSRWSSETPQVVELSTGDAPASEPETRALIDLIERLAPPWALSLHAPIGVVIEPVPTAVGDALVSRTGLPRVDAVRYSTPGVLDSWARERGIPCLTLELPHITHNDAVIRFAPVLADLIRGAFPTAA
jgi:murein peptide amidase A